MTLGPAVFLSCFLSLHFVEFLDLLCGFVVFIRYA